MVEALALGALGLIGYAAISRRTADSVLTAPMWFTALGYVGAQLLGRDLDLHMQANWVHLVAEIALVVVLFVDASQIDLARLRVERALPIRLLGVGLPLTIALGAVGARVVFPEMSWWEAGLIASILAPTDAALGQAVISNPAVPERIRQALGVESGLNDGIALPVVLLCLYAFELEHAHGSSAGYWTRFVSMQLLLGPLVGAAVGALGGWLVTTASRAGWMTRGCQQLSLIGLAVLAFALAEVCGGNGFLSAFVGGLVLGNTAREASRRVVEFGETEGQLLCAVTFMTFGALMVPVALADAGADTWLYAGLSLTVIRALPVVLSLTGLRLDAATLAFLAWFGPRGIASLLYALIVVEAASGAVAHEVVTVVATTVLLSVALHGVTAAPWAQAYGARRGGGSGLRRRPG